MSFYKHKDVIYKIQWRTIGLEWTQKVHKGYFSQIKNILYAIPGNRLKWKRRKKEGKKEGKPKILKNLPLSPKHTKTIRF